jgi:hypothetical protein
MVILSVRRPQPDGCAVAFRAGFNPIINVAGGFNAWTSEAAFLGEEKGVALFDGVASVESALAVAYSLEAGLKDFYEVHGGEGGQ